MSKKLTAVALSGVLAAAMLASCSNSSTSSETTTTDGTTTTTVAADSSDNGTSAADSAETTQLDNASGDNASGGGTTTLRLVNGKIEVDAQLKDLAAAYEAETGVTVEIESMGGGVDIQSTLKGYYQADNMPDIFVCGSDSDFANWEGLVADLSDSAWTSDTDSAYVNDAGQVVGFPYTTEAIGLTYNKNILEEAGIDPSTITGPDTLQAAFETLEAKKDELGLDAVIGYSAESTNLYWSTGNHLFGVYLDAGLARDDTTYIDLLNDGGQLDEARFTDYANMVALFNQYSDPALLVSGTYDQQILNFASGKYAFVTQGSWIGATMTSDDKEQYEAAGSFEVGMLPYAFEEGIDTIQTNSPSWWVVYNNDNSEAAKAFLQWCSEDAGQKILVEEAGFISPFKSSQYIADDPFAQTISDYTTSNKTSAWHWLQTKDGIAQNATGVVYQDFASGNLTATEFVSTMQQVCEQYYAN